MLLFGRRSLSFLWTFLVVAASTAGDIVVNAINVGDSIPDGLSLHYGFPPQSIDLKDRVPGYLQQLDVLENKLGIDEVLIYCVNDGAVMTAWAEDQGVPENSILTLMGDPTAAVTKALDMELTHPGPQSIGLLQRCKRFALYLEDGVVKIVRVAEAPDDPAGDDYPDITLAEAMVEAIQELQSGGSMQEL